MGLFDWLRRSTAPVSYPPVTVAPEPAADSHRPEAGASPSSPVLSAVESDYLHSSRWDELLAPTERFPNLRLSEYRGELWLMETTTSQLVKVGNRHLAHLGIWTAAVRGISFYETAVLLSDTSPGQPLELVREPDNAHDKNAIRVHSGGKLIGYVNKQMASRLARRMDSGLELDAISLAGSRRGRDVSRIQVLGAEPHLLRHLRGELR